MLKEFTPRLYQQTITATCVTSNCLVVIPTGMGKTGVALLLTAHRLKTHPQSKVIIMAPTKPLVSQHMETFAKHLNIPEEKLVLFTGSVSPEKRQKMFQTAQVIFSTPQTLENDIISNRIDLRDVSLMVFDEAHRATGDYSYVWIAKRYNEIAKYPRTLALTASPGSDTEKITEVIQNLHLDAIEIRTADDPDVKPYIQKTALKWIKVDFPPEFEEARSFLKKSYESKLAEVKELGLLPNIPIDSFSKKELLSLQAQFHSQVARGEKDFDTLKGISFLAQAMKVSHAIELIETQTLNSTYTYIKRIFTDAHTSKVKAVINLVKDPNFKMAWVKISKLKEKGQEHPKVDRLKSVVSDKLGPEVKLIVFTQFRDTATVLKRELETVDGVNAEIFVGQAKKNGTGLSQKDQIAMLRRFAEGEFNILIATSVAEEGIDIPKVDAVIFYEPVPSSIRHIQRKGRTGRTEQGEIQILYAAKTRDEAYKWSAYHKEKRMYTELGKLRGSTDIYTANTIHENRTLKEFTGSQLYIHVDYREKGSHVIKELIELGVKINLQRLECGDYVLSTRVGVEFKNVPDFVSSIIDGRLLNQVRELRNNFARPLIIVEGTEDMYSIRKIHPNAILGMLATIAVSYGVPIIQTKNYRETANLLYIIAKNDQQPEQSEYSMHTSKPHSMKEQQEYIVSALPNIGPAVAKPLLMHFGTVRKLMEATPDELKKVELIGQKKADAITEVLDTVYGEPSNPPDSP